MFIEIDPGTIINVRLLEQARMVTNGGNEYLELRYQLRPDAVFIPCSSAGEAKDKLDMIVCETTKAFIND